MKTVTKNIGVYGVGTIFCLELTDIKNEGTESVANVEIVVTMPAGVVYSSSNLEQGSYDAMTDKWLVGTMLAGADLQGTICYQVTDPAEGPYTFTFTITSPASCVGCDEDTQFCIVTEGINCNDVNNCVAHWPEAETAAYTEGADQVYARAYVITDAVSGTPYALTDFPVATRDIIDVSGSIKYDNAGTLTIANVPSNDTLEGVTYWELDIPAGIVGAFTVRVKVLYKKQAASTD